MIFFKTWAIKLKLRLSAARLRYLGVLKKNRNVGDILHATYPKKILKDCRLNLIFRG
ncbi:MAG: hypothetical protein ACJ0G4_01670 [Alphaproteobacteria bacterium]